MEKYVFSKEICYSQRLKTKVRVRYALTCSLSVLFSTGLILGITLGLVHQKNYTGQGGLETPGIPDLTADLLPKDFYKLTDENDLRAPEEEIIPQTLSDIIPAAEPLIAVSADAAEENLPDQETVDLMQLEEVAETTENLENDSPLYYTVYRLKQGENASIVASQFGVSTDTILSVNGVANATRMATGAYLKIPSMSGIIYEVSKNGETLESIVNSENKTKKVSLDMDMISLVNGVMPTEKLSVGDTLFIAGGKLSNEQRAEISGDSYKKPLRNSYYISSPYGWRVSPFDATRRSYHNGIDLACPKGTPIYATAAGTVVTAGYSNVYGNYVIIKHTSGYKSLYGHMSVVNVKNGQYVDQGTVIGKVGSTGQSTGPHLHFTMYKNNKVINPNEKVYF